MENRQMEYEEVMAAQKLKYFALASRLDRFWNGFSGPDPAWDIPYPIPRCKGRWGRCYASRYQGTTYFGFSGRWRVEANAAKDLFSLDDDRIWRGRQDMLAGADDVLAWLGQVERDPDKANRRIAEEYPKDERLGVIPRSVVERHIPDAYSIGKELGAAKTRAFVGIHASGYFHREENSQVVDMTANKFFEYCRIAYLASERKEDHFDHNLSGRELYSRHADGRCGALLEIDPDSPDQFLAWLDGKIPCDRDCGDHPWEIKRGGNTTHIDLYVCRPREYGWFPKNDNADPKLARTVSVGLRGHHICRIVETVKMFLALHKAGFPITIDDADEVRDRLAGLGWMGIIPESRSLHRGWQEFPANFHVADVMHFSEFGRARRFALPFVSWKPMPVILPRRRGSHPIRRRSGDS